MRPIIACAALALAAVPKPAEATLFPEITFSVVVFGTEDRVYCHNITDCQAQFGTDTGYEYGIPFSMEVGDSLFYQEIAEGASLNFEIDNGRYNSFFTGTITNIGGRLTGTNLFYFLDECHAFPTGECSTFRGTAATFQVTGGVPEPTTWAMMLIGFAGIGTAIRRQRARLAAA